MNTKTVIASMIDVGHESVAALESAAGYVSLSGGLIPGDIWKSESSDPIERTRDEFFICGLTLVPIVRLLAKAETKHDWRTPFDVTYIWQLKPLVQSLITIDLLCQRNCYFDAAILVRSLHSRVLQTVIFSLNPFLYDKWLNEPKAEIFFEGHIRRELKNHNIFVYPHIYDWFSEIVHGQALAYSDIGYFQKGLFNELAPAKNLVYTAGKFLFGVVCWVGISALLLDYSEDKSELDAEPIFELMNAIKDKILIPNRLDHIWTMFPEDRHLEKVGKNKYRIRYFDFNEYQRQLMLFHRELKPKRLNKKYCCS